MNRGENYSARADQDFASSPLFFMYLVECFLERTTGDIFGGFRVLPERQCIINGDDFVCSKRRLYQTISMFAGSIGKLLKLNLYWMSTNLGS